MKHKELLESLLSEAGETSGLKNKKIKISELETFFGNIIHDIEIVMETGGIYGNVSYPDKIKTRTLTLGGKRDVKSAQVHHKHSSAVTYIYSMDGTCTINYNDKDFILLIKGVEFITVT